MKLCQSTLREHYKRCLGWVQPVPWVSDLQLQLSEVYSQLQIALRDKKANIIEHRKQELLDSLSSLSTPKRVLLEGPAGIGKTTFLRKLAYDWAQSDLETHLDQYKLVFLIDCNQFLQGTLEDAIYEQLLPDDTLVNKEALVKFISIRQHEVLFLIDGFDELPNAQKPYLNRVVECKVLMSTCLVLTSRADQLEHLNRFMDKHFIVQGFSRESINEYVRKYFDKDSSLASQLLTKINSDTFLQNLAENPLHIALLCLLWESNAGTLPSTLTKVYNQIVLCLVRRFCQRTGRPEPKADSFSELSDDLRSLLRGMGTLAMGSLKKEVAGFDKAFLEGKVENSGELLQLGLLTQEAGASLLRQETYWVFVNKSFQEFFAAYAITQSDSKNDPSFVRSFLLRHRNVLIFVIGLLCKESGAIFEVLKKSHLSKEFLLRCLAESHSGIHLAEILVPELVKNNCFQFNSDMCGDVRGLSAAADIIDSIRERCTNPQEDWLLFGLLLSEKHVLSSDFKRLLAALKNSINLTHFFLELPTMSYASQTQRNISNGLCEIFTNTPIESVCLISNDFRKDDILKSLAEKDQLKTLFLNVDIGEVDRVASMVEMVLNNSSLQYLVLMFLCGERQKKEDRKQWNKGIQKLLTLLKGHSVKSAIMYAGSEMTLDGSEHWDTWQYRYFECPYYFDTVVTHHIHQIYASVMNSHKDDVIQGLCDELHDLGGSFGVDVFLYFKE